jgi:hypothetical protein
MSRGYVERLVIKEKNLDILIFRIGNSYEVHATNTKLPRMSIARGEEKWSTITEGIERALSPKKSR